jgi:anti-sigma regulatory factor (Ser/Thr protein kinase)
MTSKPARIILTNRMSELARASDWLAAWAEGQDLPPPVTFAIRLCLEEILANIVMHAFSGGTHTIQLDLRRDGQEAVLSVVDDGKPFDPLAAPAPIQTTDLAEADPSGRGLILVKSYASRLAYGHEDGRNHLLLAFTLAGHTPKPDR